MVRKKVENNGSMRQGIHLFLSFATLLNASPVRALDDHCSRVLELVNVALRFAHPHERVSFDSSLLRQLMKEKKNFNLGPKELESLRVEYRKTMARNFNLSEDSLAPYSPPRSATGHLLAKVLAVLPDKSFEIILDQFIEQHPDQLVPMLQEQPDFAKIVLLEIQKKYPEKIARLIADQKQLNRKQLLEAGFNLLLLTPGTTGIVLMVLCVFNPRPSKLCLEDRLKAPQPKLLDER